MNLDQSNTYSIGGTHSAELYRNAVADILRDCQFKDPKRIAVLDVGSGRGHYSFALAPRVKKVVGVEPYRSAYETAVKRNKFPNVTFHNLLIEDFQSDDRFDLVLSISTLEHMPDADASFRSMIALLKPGGKLYLIAPNKLWPFESHYGLPFLSWLPLPFANHYLRLATGKKSYEDSSYAKTYYGLKQFLRQFPCSYQFVLPDPSASYLGMGTYSRWQHLVKNLGIQAIERFPFMWTFSKGFIVVLEKHRT
jgi:2-polyprenyl-3-methyl-5-hydroxy-6-metoxy-1,4-benzoquinol methylase